jgi:hypothetical protein
MRASREKAGMATRLKPGQVGPEDIEANKYNNFAHLAQQ